MHSPVAAAVNTKPGPNQGPNPSRADKAPPSPFSHIKEGQLQQLRGAEPLVRVVVQAGPQELKH